MPGFLKRFFSNGHLVAAAAIILTALLTFGTAIPRLGYYHDDWYMLWSAALRGPASLISLFSMDRPFMGVIYSLTYRVIGESIPGWHLAALAFRIAGALAFYWILNLTWPKYKSLFGLAAILFLVYPGYLSQPNAATKINHLIGFGAALFSIALTLQSIKTSRPGRKWIFTGLSVLLTAVYLWIYEYMIGLEVMRLLLMFWLYWQGDRKAVLPALKKVILAYLPYLLVMGVFIYWRVFEFDSTRSATDMKGLVSDYRGDLVGMLIRLVFQVIKDFLSAGLFAWLVQGYHLVTRAGSREILTALGMTAVLVALVLGYIRFSRTAGPSPADEAPSPLWLVLFGGLITLGAVFPVVLSNRFLNLMDPYKSYGLHPSPGVIILVLGLILMIRPNYRSLVILALVGCSVATQSLNTQDWIRYWDIQREFWWQLTWRAPDIRDDTLIMAYTPDGYALQQDYEMWGPVNLIYRPDPDIVPAIQAEVLNQDTVYDVYEGKFADPYVRDIFVPKYFKNLLLISQPSLGACIHVIDRKMPLYSTNERLIIEKAGPYSQIDRIQASASSKIPPEAIFGKEPEHGWCYYFQKASLARQTGNWAKIGELFDAALGAGVKPADPAEYFVFIEGLANLGRLEEARSIVNEHIRENEKLKVSLCRSLDSAPRYPGKFGYQLDVIQPLICE